MSCCFLIFKLVQALNFFEKTNRGNIWFVKKKKRKMTVPKYYLKTSVEKTKLENTTTKQKKKIKEKNHLMNMF